MVGLFCPRNQGRNKPYSLRRTLDGNIILHAYDTGKTGHRSYRVDRIQGAQSTAQSFVPRYAVELTPAGPVTFQPNTTRTTGFPSQRETKTGLPSPLQKG